MTLGSLSRSLATPQHFREGYESNRELLGFCAQEVDKALSVVVQQAKAKLLAKIDAMDSQLQALECNMR